MAKLTYVTLVIPMNHRMDDNLYRPLCKKLEILCRRFIAKETGGGTDFTGYEISFLIQSRVTAFKAELKKLNETYQVSSQVWPYDN